MSDRRQREPVEGAAPETPEFSPEEFSITELEDRLEFAPLCDDNCHCPGDSPNPG